MAETLSTARLTVDLSGRNAFVTGASGGLGEHFARTLAGAGASVAIGARRVDRLETLAGRIETDGGRAHVVRLDVTEGASVEAALQLAEAALGPITIVVNNSGVAAVAPALDVADAEFDRVVDTNLKGVWRVAQASARRMVANDTGGTIINLASVASFRVMSKLAPYAASKAAVRQLTAALAVEWARHRIRVNAIAPGYILTEMNRSFFESPASAPVIRGIPQRRVGDPADLDGVLLLLASDASSYMTGSTVVVDGGYMHLPL